LRETLGDTGVSQCFSPLAQKSTSFVHIKALHTLMER
jgi:hypothetical protein